MFMKKITSEMDELRYLTVILYQKHAIYTQLVSYGSMHADIIGKVAVGLMKVKGGCWEWVRGRHNLGYGVVCRGKEALKVHRIVLEVKLGRSLSSQEYACHKCDNPPCANPDHLFMGSPKDNYDDSKRKGRARYIPLVPGAYRAFLNGKRDR